MNKQIAISILVFTAVAFIVTAILLLTGPRMKTQSSIRTFEARASLPPEDIVTFYENENDLDREGIHVLPPASPENIQKGKVYYGYYCVFCHGENGQGNGPVGESYMPRPADLNLTYRKDFNVQGLYEASFTGPGHEEVLKRVVPFKHREYLLLYIRHQFGPGR